MQYDKDLQAKHSALFLEIRNILLKTSGIHELKKPRITTYTYGQSGLCHMRTMPHGIDIGFLRGAKMADKYELLTGSGKVMRVLRVNSLTPAYQKIIHYYLTQAINLNEKN